MVNARRIVLGGTWYFSPSAVSVGCVKRVVFRLPPCARGQYAMRAVSCWVMVGRRSYSIPREARWYITWLTWQLVPWGSL